MFIEFEETPNPDTLKFLPGLPVLPQGGTRDYKTADDAAYSRLARSLFDVEGVAGVFFGGTFISVTKTPQAEWPMMKPHILGRIMEHFTAGFPAVDEPSAAADASDEDDEVVSQIKELLNTRVKPAVAMDGGNIEFTRFDDGIVYLRLEGACSGCPSSTMTLKHGIENMLRHYIPEVLRVEPDYA